jgi:PhnB protein
MKGVPEGFHTVTPYLVLRNAARAIEFYQQAFGATVLFRAMHPDGGIMHAEIMIGNSPVMITDESPNFPQLRSPQTMGGSPISLFLYVEDADAMAKQAVEAGAKMTWPMEDADDGDRRCGIEDPFGVTWWIATQVKRISRAELQKQYDEMLKQQSEGQ